jgi:hypothetical protein
MDRFGGFIARRLNPPVGKADFINQDGLDCSFNLNVLQALWIFSFIMSLVCTAFTLHQLVRQVSRVKSTVALLSEQR